MNIIFTKEEAILSFETIRFEFDNKSKSPQDIETWYENFINLWSSIDLKLHRTISDWIKTVRSSGLIMNNFKLDYSKGDSDYGDLRKGEVDIQITTTESIKIIKFSFEGNWCRLADYSIVDKYTCSDLKKICGDNIDILFLESEIDKLKKRILIKAGIKGDF